MDCASFWCDSGYREDAAQLKRDLDWGVSVCERNRQGAHELLRSLAVEGADCSSVLEIGCGVGAFLSAASERGLSAVGYDVNKEAIDYGRKAFGLDLRAENWSPEKTPPGVTLIVSISTIEHMRQPREHVFALAAAARRAGASLFVSVPTVDRAQWHRLFKADPLEPGTWLFDNDVHVTHFSPAGLEGLVREAGAGAQSWIRTSLWSGILARPAGTAPLTSGTADEKAP